MTRTEHSIRRPISQLGAAIALSTALLLLAGCAPKVQIRPERDAVRIGKIQNATTVPDLENLLNDALAIQFGRHSVRVDPGGRYLIEGTLEEARVTGITMGSHLSIHYDVTIAGSFTLTGPGGTSRPLPFRGAYPVTLRRLQPQEETMAEQEQAIRNAIDDLAADLARAAVLGR